jgi:two-component system sensor histidine kinase QseC
MPASIRRRLMLLILASIVLVWTITLAWSYRQATHEVGEWDDARLVQFAQVLVLLDQHDLSTLSNTRIDVRDEYSHRRTAHPADEDTDKLPRDLMFQVRDANGRVLAGSPGLVPLGMWQLPPGSADGSYAMTRRGQVWNTYSRHDGPTGRSVLVLEPSNSRSDLATGVARRIVKPIAFALPILALLVWLSIGHSLSPLKALSSTIRARDASKLDPIDMGSAPAEVRPLIDAINQLLSRLSGSIKRERGFTSDAAHELKTPLAAIKVQAQVALAAQDVAQQRLAMERVVQGVDRSAHLAEQLLLLARLDEHESMLTSAVALDELARDAVVANQPDALRKDMNVCVADDTRANVMAEPALLGILLDNLIDNAIKYGDVGGQVEVAIQRMTHAVVLIVRDNGPGVGAEERLRLTDRFFRGTATSANGSGLGLSIVARIVEYFGAQLDFDAGIDGRGLAVKVAFPCAIPAPGHVLGAHN